MTPRLVIFLGGGLIQNMSSSEEMEVLILDYDTEGCDETREIVEWDFSKKMPSEDDRNEVFDRVPRSSSIDPEAVEHYFGQMEGGEGADDGEEGDRRSDSEKP